MIAEVYYNNNHQEGECYVVQVENTRLEFSSPVRKDDRRDHDCTDQGEKDGRSMKRITLCVVG